MRIRAFLLVLLAALCLLATTAAGAGARSSEKKGLWATYEPNPELTFPIYRDLGVRTLLLSVGWDEVAQGRPVDARNPGDPAYHWPASIDAAIRLAPQFGMRTMVRVMYAPPLGKRWPRAQRATSPYYGLHRRSCGLRPGAGRRCAVADLGRAKPASLVGAHALYRASGRRAARLSCRVRASTLACSTRPTAR